MSLKEGDSALPFEVMILAFLVMGIEVDILMVLSVMYEIILFYAYFFFLSDLCHCHQGSFISFLPFCYLLFFKTQL